MNKNKLLIIGIFLLVVTIFQVSASTSACKAIGSTCSDTTECCPTYLTDHGNFYGYCDTECKPSDGLNGDYNNLEWCSNIVSVPRLYTFYSSYQQTSSSPVHNFLGWPQGTSCSNLFPEFTTNMYSLGPGFSGIYDSRNNLISIYDESSKRIETNYQDNYGYGGAYATDSAVSGATIVSKDPSGKVLQVVDANRNKVQNYYDSLNRLVKSEYYISSQLNYKVEYYYDTYSSFSGGDKCTQDENGNLISSLNLLCEVRDNSGYTKFTYDQRARVIKQEKTIYESDIKISDRTYILKFSYDSANNILRTILPDNNSIYYYYNNIGQLEKLKYGATEQGSQEITNLSYNAFGGVQTKTLDPQGTNKITASFTYNQKQLLTSLLFSGTTFNFGRTMAYDLVGNVLGISHSVDQNNPGVITQNTPLNEKYTYDSLYRLNQTIYNEAGKPPGIITYNYKNLWGDRNNIVISNTPGLTSTTYSYSDNNFRLTSSVSGSKETAYEYDWVGNIVRASGNSDSQFVYDALNRMVTSKVSGEESQYIYDYNNERVKKKTPTDVTFYLYQGNNVIYEEKINLGTPACPVKCGDITGDDKVDVDDFNYLLNYFYGVSPAKNLCAADVDNSGKIDAADLTYLAENIYKNGSAPNCNFTASLSQDVGASAGAIKMYLKLHLNN